MDHRPPIEEGPGPDWTPPRPPRPRPTCVAGVRPTRYADDQVSEHLAEATPPEQPALF